MDVADLALIIGGATVFGFLAAFGVMALVRRFR
jgi:hypothetical protein